MDKNKFISIKGARVNNLRNISIDIPKGKFVVITGPSGSGKSSLAFDTLFAEGQRRYLESLSLYSRQFLDLIEPPDVDKIFGLTPAVAIDQKNNSNNPRSTVGTATDIYDLMRVLFTQHGEINKTNNSEVEIKKSEPQITKEIIKNFKGNKLIILAPIDSNKKNLTTLLKRGFSRALQGDEIFELEEFETHTIDGIVIDRLIIDTKNSNRIESGIGIAYSLCYGHCRLKIGETLYNYHQESKVLVNDVLEKFPVIESRLFSFNSSYGACTTCNGIGKIDSVNSENIVADEDLPLLEGGIPLLTTAGPVFISMLKDLLSAHKVSTNAPWKKINQKLKDEILFGAAKKYKDKQTSTTHEFPGVLSYFNNLKDSIAKKDHADIFLIDCPQCLGKRLNPFSLMIKISGLNIAQICELDIVECLKFFKSLEENKFKNSIKILREIISRLHFLHNVGLSYLSLNRSISTLSGGESQRIKLAAQLGSSLSGITYILDEPTIGLHPIDNLKLINSIKGLTILNNSVIVVEHDKDTILAADYLIDIGPGAGVHGGNIINKGNLIEFLKSTETTTARYLNGTLEVSINKQRKVNIANAITLEDCSKYNIKNENFIIPVNCMVGIVGSSGSGKSTLIHEILAPALKKKEISFFDNSNFKNIITPIKVDSIIELDQSPIGRSPKSNPATFTGMFDLIRDLFAGQKESKLKGYTKSRFSFNVKQGRCETCEGNGKIRVEMHFLPDVFVTCNVCRGKRYNEETLKIKFKGYSINDVLNLTIAEALELFKLYPKLFSVLNIFNELGLGYIKLGQSSTSISGGEAQRLKLVKELAKNPRGHTLYIFDEPTTGLHFQDIRLLIEALHKLVDKGNSVVIIEHNTDIINSCDYIVEMGPEGGSNGGKNIFSGTLGELKKSKNSKIAKFLN